MDVKAAHMHHIFPESIFPEICYYLENIIALTPTQHLNYAHPNGRHKKLMNNISIYFYYQKQIEFKKICFLLQLKKYMILTVYYMF